MVWAWRHQVIISTNIDHAPLMPCGTTHQGSKSSGVGIKFLLGKHSQADKLIKYAIQYHLAEFTFLETLIQHLWAPVEHAELF